MTILTLNCKYRKIYKEKRINIISMFPGDPSGSPDDFFDSIFGGLEFLKIMMAVKKAKI